MPQYAAGIRIEPPVSVPSASAQAPAATSAAEPPEDPPEVRAGSRGLRVSPTCGCAKPAAYSRHWLVAKTSAPAARSRATTAASDLAGSGLLAGLPHRVGTPATSMMSLTATGRPASGPPAARSGAPITLTTAFSGRPSRSARSQAASRSRFSREQERRPCSMARTRSTTRGGSEPVRSPRIAGTSVGRCRIARSR